MITGTKRDIINFLVDAPEKVYDLKEHREKRSLSANAYYWVLLTKLAEKIETSNAELHNSLLCRYGQYEIGESGNILTITMRSVIPMKRVVEIMHVEPFHTNGEITEYRLLRGSHTYDIKEMSRLLNGLISECKECGIETMTPEELERLRGYEAQAKHYHG